MTLLRALACTLVLGFAGCADSSGLFRGQTPEATWVRDQHRNQWQQELLKASNQACDAFLQQLRGSISPGSTLSSADNHRDWTAQSLTDDWEAIEEVLSARLAQKGIAIQRPWRRPGRGDLETAASLTERLIDVIEQGVRQSRASLAQEMARRRTLPLEAYTPEHALNDAVQYHSACTPHAGLQYLYRLTK